MHLLPLYVSIGELVGLELCTFAYHSFTPDPNSMSTNPYESPKTESAPKAVGVKSGLREDLIAVATYQKGILVCILIYLVFVATQFILPPELRIFLLLGVVLLGIVATVFVFLLATKVYSTPVGILLGLITLVPCVGLIGLLIVNGKATSILKDNGITVGLIGADMSQL